MHKSFRGKKLLAGLMLFTMLSSVVADSNVVTALAVDNEVNISESEIVLEKEEYQNDIPTESGATSDQNSIPNTLNENNALEEKNNSDKDNALKEDYQEDSLIEVTPDSNTNQEKTPDKTPEITEENKDFNKELIVDGYKIAIQAAEGVFPVGTKVEIETVDTIGDEDAQDVISEEMEEIEPNAEIVKTVTFDINFYSEEGEIIEPENGSVNITITPNLQETAELQEMENELGTSLECSVLHVDDELNAEEIECEITEDYTEVSFDAESFSTYTVIWYATPDAEGNQEPSLEGPKYIDGFEKVPFNFSEFNIPIAWTNDNGEAVLRPTKLEFTVYGTDTSAETGSGNRIKICDVNVTLTEDEKKASNITINLADEIKIPVYVKKGTGEIKSGGDGHYVMSNFEYEVKLHDENIAYTAKYVPVASDCSVVTTHQEDNEAIWYANAGKITNERKNLADASFKIEWYDNHDENHKRPYSTDDEDANKNAIKSKVALYYCTADDPTLKPVTNDMMPAGEDETGPIISKDSYSTWSISYKNLIPKDENDKEIIYKLKIADNFADENYTSDSNNYIEKNGTRRYSYLGKFTASIRWNDGGRDNELRPESALKFNLITIKDGVSTSADVDPEDIIIRKNGNTWEFEVDKLVMYSDDGVVSYYVTLKEDDLLADHNYTVSYTNAPKSTDVSKCHDEGIIYLTLTNDLSSFIIHKKWLDGKDGDTTDDGRKDFIDQGITLYLWRYPVKKVIGDEKVVSGTIEDGAPVNNANGEQYSYLLNKDNHSKNFNLSLKDFVGENGTLDMYDTQGYEYVYYVTEIMGGNEYVTSYSNVNPYTHIVTAVADGGTLTNLRKESIKIEGIVRWRVPSVTDYTKATATISLQRCDRETGEWIDVGNPVTVTGFTEADPQKKHVFPAVDKFDEEGNEIKYRVIETKINYNGKDIDVVDYKSVEEAGKEDYYVSRDYIMNEFDYTATAHPTYSNPLTEAEKYSFTVENRMSGDVELDITKVWATKAAYAGEEGEAGNYSDISIKIYQKDYSGDEKLFGTVVVNNVNQKTGEITGNSATLTKTSGGSETVPITVVSKDTDANLIWSFAGIELPEFDSNGRAYTYSIKETGISNTHTDYGYEFDGKDIDATVTNTYVPSGGDSHFYFEIEKEWIDGADLSQRQPVTVAIVSVDNEGNYKYEDNEGKTHEYVLSAENNWHEDVWISKTYTDNGVVKDRFNKVDDTNQYLWTVIEKDVSLKVDYEKYDGTDFAADDKMDEIHRQVKEYPTTLFLDATKIEGKVVAIAHNDIHKPGYEVTIEAVPAKPDETDPSVIGASKYKVTNRRAGEVNVTFDKTWHDSDNMAGTRGDLKVYLYQNDKKVTNEESKANSYPDEYVYIAGINNPANAVKKGDGNSNFEYKFEGLPKYDGHGVEYEYSVREFMVCKDEEIEILTYDTEDTTLSGYVADIEGHGESVTFTTNNEKLIRNELYKYNNTLTGKLTTGVPFYVLWHDQSSYEAGGRPDMYFTLYYRPIGGTDDQIKKFEGDYKVIWEALKEEESGPSNPYYKKATFIGLPAADEKGNAYEFFASASLNNAADHYDEYYYNTHDDAIVLDGKSGKAEVFANEDKTIHHYDIKGDAQNNKVKDINGLKLIPVEGLVEYIIHEEIRPTGKKYWKNVEQGISAADLPNVEIYLGRYSDHDKENQMYQMYSAADPTVQFGKKIAITTLDDDKLSFNFETKADNKAPYAKYDSYGQIYTYQLAEKIYVNSTDPDKKYQVPNYIMKYDPDSLNLVNTYLYGEDDHVGSRSIAVNKTWTIDSEILSKINSNQYPEARFKLYRMEFDPSDCEDTANGDIPFNPIIREASETASAIDKYSDVVDNFDELKNNGLFKECGNELKIRYGATSQTASWDDMPIYAPSGRPYLYVVEETSGHGMNAYDIDNNANKASFENNERISKTQVLISNFGLNPAGTYNDDANKKSVGFTNTLNNGDTFSKITGEKVWSDNTTLFTDVRPATTDCDTYAEGNTTPRIGNKPVELVLTRTAGSQTGVSNLISKELKEGEDYKVTWSETAGTNKWKYEIEPLNAGEFQVYAPNGRPYTYTVTEKLNGVADENYNATVSRASRQATYATGTPKILTETPTLSNTLKGQIQLFKKWDDALNELNLRSGHVNVILQYREVSLENYVMGANAEKAWTTYKKDSEDDGIYTLNYKDNKWKINVPNLPIKNNDGTSVYEYRVLETEFDDHVSTINPVKYNKDTDEVKYIKKVDDSEKELDVPKGGTDYNNSTRFPGIGHFETKVPNYLVNHSIIANLKEENTRRLQVENFLSDTAQLVVEKKWDGIEGEDIYGVLPDNIVFVVQYSTTPEIASSWATLYNKDGNPVTVTVSKSLPKDEDEDEDEDKEYVWRHSVEEQLLLETDGKWTHYRAIELGTNLGRFEGYNGEGKPMLEKNPTSEGVEHVHYSEHNYAENRTESSTIATNTLATRNLTVKKKWNDAAEAVHGDVEIELLSSNYNTGVDGSEPFTKVPGTEATLEKSKGYEFTYHNLPLKNKNGIPIVYYVKEVKVDGAAYDTTSTKYDTAFFVSKDGSNYSKVSANSNAKNIAAIDKNGTAKAVCIVNTPKTSLNVTKKWNDENNRHNLRTGVVFKLTYNDGKSWSSITTNTDDNKKYSFTKLPIYNSPDEAFVTSSDDNMGKVKYTVTEDNTNVKHFGYKDPVYTVNGAPATTGTLELAPSANSNNIIVLNEYNPPKATITADKLWDDENNRHGSRTSQVELSLYYRVGTTGNWNLITKKPLVKGNYSDNYSDGGVYTTSEVTQSLSRDEVSSDNPNKWAHDGHSSTFTTWENLPTVDENNKTIYYKVLETSGDAKATVPANYTGDFSGYEVFYSDSNGSTFTNNGESKNQIVTNKLKRTEILVEKDWNDTAEQKIRPYSVTFELEYKHANMPWRLYKEENGDVKKVVVTGDHDSKTWTKLVTDLPFADCEGHEYEYRFKEVSIKISGDEVVNDLEDDDSSFSGTTWKGEIGTYDDTVEIVKSSGTSYNYKVTATNTPDVGSITVTKVWDDNNNRDGLRPNTIDVTLYRDGKVYDEKAIGLKEDGTPLAGTTVTNANEWTYTWTNLPMYKDNAGVHDKERMSSHYVVEEPISDDIVLNYKQATYGNFREYIDNPIASHVQSRVSEEDDRDTDLWIKNTHEPIRFKIDAYKKWDDNHNAHNERPTSIDLLLQYRIYGSTSESDWKNVAEKISVSNLDKTGEKVETTSANPQTVSKSGDEGVPYPDIWGIPGVWENLPAYVLDSDKKPKLIEYRVKEVWPTGVEDHYYAVLPHFYYDIEEAKVTKADETYPKHPLIVENLSDYNSTLTVIKEWDNKELLEKYGALPIELHVKLQEWNEGSNEWVDCANALNPRAILKENEDDENSWTHTYQGLTQGHEYRVIEEKIVFEKGDKKISIESELPATSTTTLSDRGNGTIGNFDINASVKVLKTATIGEVTSTHWEATLKNSISNRSLEVTKKWNDEKDRDKLRPTHIFVTLKRDGKVLEIVKLEEANNWHYAWDHLPLYKNETKEDDTPILSEYTLFETDIHGESVSLEPEYKATYSITYDKSNPSSEKADITETKAFDLSKVDAGNTAEILVTNTHETAKTTVHAGKQWDDYSNKYGERADKVYLALFYKYQHEGESQWRLIDKVTEDNLDSKGLYKDSLIHTTSEPVQELTGTGDYWKDYENVNWKNLPSQAVVEEGAATKVRVIRIPEYRVVEINEDIKNNLSAHNNNLKTTVDALDSVIDITSVIRGYKTTQPDAFFVHGGDDNISFVNGGNDKEDKTIVVVNKLETVSALIIKKWEDQHNKFADRPIRVEFAIQKKQKDVPGSGWQSLTANGKSVIVSVTPDMLGDDEDTWKLSVDGLPKCDVEGKELSYRAVEISLVYGGKTVSVYDESNWFNDSLPTINIGNGHGYETSETEPILLDSPDKIEYQTTITNKQDSSVKVTAKKAWNDYKNGRNTRQLFVVFAIEKKPVQNNKVEQIIDEILNFFKENGGWTPVYELDGTGEKVLATITLDAPDFDEVSLVGLPLYDENGKELVYRAREIQLVYENRTVDISSGANPYLAPTYVDEEPDISPTPVNGITHSYKTEATNRIKPDPPKPTDDGDPETPSGPTVPPVTPPEDPEKPDLPPELEKIDEEIENIDEPEDIVPIVDELIDLPDSPEKDYVVKELWEIVSKLAEDPTFYDHFDPEMQDILKRFVRTGVLGRRRGLPKTGGLMGSYIILLMGLALIVTGTRLKKKAEERNNEIIKS